MRNPKVKCVVCRKNYATPTYFITCEELSCHRKWRVYNEYRQKYTEAEAKREIRDISQISRRARELRQVASRLRDLITIEKALKRRRL